MAVVLTKRNTGDGCPPTVTGFVGQLSGGYRPGASHFCASPVKQIIGINMKFSTIFSKDILKIFAGSHKRDGDAVNEYQIDNDTRSRLADLFC